MSATDRLIDAAVRCTKCGAQGVGTCDCWNTPTPSILLRCPGCRREVNADRADYDPPTAVTLVLQCPECNPSDFDSLRYLDADGREVTQEDGR